MAAADYLLCANCNSKTIYDADINYDVPNHGEITALCTDCTEAGYKIVIADPSVIIEENP